MKIRLGFDFKIMYLVSLKLIYKKEDYLFLRIFYRYTKECTIYVQINKCLYTFIALAKSKKYIFILAVINFFIEAKNSLNVK